MDGENTSIWDLSNPINGVMLLIFVIALFAFIFWIAFKFGGKRGKRGKNDKIVE